MRHLFCQHRRLLGPITVLSQLCDMVLVLQYYVVLVYCNDSYSLPSVSLTCNRTEGTVAFGCCAHTNPCTLPAVHCCTSNNCALIELQKGFPQSPPQGCISIFCIREPLWFQGRTALCVGGGWTKQAHSWQSMGNSQTHDMECEQYVTVYVTSVPIKQTPTLGC